MHHHHTQATYYGGIRDLETLRGRCVIHGACWVLRSARGRPVTRPIIHVHGRGTIAAPRVSWEWQHGRPVPHDHDVRICCQHHPLDCVRHVEAIPTVQRRAQVAGRMTAKRLASLRAIGRKRSSLSDELIQWARESPQIQADIAHALGLSRSQINRICTRKSANLDRGFSAFNWRSAR